MDNIIYEHLWAQSSKFETYETILTQNKCVVFFDGAVEFELTPLTKRLVQTDILEKAEKVIWISGGFDLGDMNFITIPNNFEIYHWPTFFFTNTVLNLETFPIWTQFKKDISSIHDIKHKFISYNRKSHNHRCLLIDQFAKYDLIKDNLVSWQLPTSDFNFRHFKQEVLSIDQPHLTLDDLNAQHILAPNHNNAFMNVIAESSTSEPIFITEKTVKALVAGDIFLVFGSRGFHSKLKELGFELFTEIFDYSFDSKDTYSRLNGVIENINKLPEDYNTLSSIKESLRDKIIHNHNLAIEIARSTKYINPGTLEVLNTYFDSIDKEFTTHKTVKYLNLWKKIYT